MEAITLISSCFWKKLQTLGFVGVFIANIRIWICFNPKKFYDQNFKANLASKNSVGQNLNRHLVH